MQIKVHLQARKIGLILGIIALFLALQSIFTEYLVETYIGPQSNNTFALVLDLFSVNLEESIPTWFSTIDLFIAAMLFALIAIEAYKRQEIFRFYWAGLAVLFVYLSMDEGAVIHEIIAEPLHILFQTSGFLEFGWQIVAFPLVVILGLIYLRFLFHLPLRIRILFIISALLYVGGALFVEGLSANQLDIDQQISLSYLAIGTVEELCEMWGVVALIYTLLLYIQDRRTVFMVDAQATPENELSEQRTKPLSHQAHKLNMKSAVILAVSLIAIVDLSFVYLSVNQPESPTVIEVDNTAFYQAMIEEYGESGIVVSYISGVFGMPSATPNKVITSLYSLYQQLMVVGLPSLNSSVVFAGDELPFDQSDMAKILLEKGQTGFIIYDTDLVGKLINH